MRKRIGCLCLLTGACLAHGLLGSATSAAPSTPQMKDAGGIPAIATFDNGLGIASDLRGDYINGVDGVQCVFFDPAAGGSGDLVFDTAFWANPNTPPRRWLNYQFVSSANGEVMNCTPPSVGGVVPASGLYKAHMVVGKIYALAPGAGALNPARFRVTDTTTLRFSDRLGPNGDCSTTVWVSRSADGKTWTIEGRLTDVAAIYQDVNGATVPTSYWHMPFRITVRLK